MDHEVPLPVEQEGRRPFRFAAESEPNEQHPDRNEDAFFASPEHRSAGVFDGISIPRGGEFAAQKANEVMTQQLSEIPNQSLVDAALKKLQQAFFLADAAVQEINRNKKPIEQVGTTAAVVKIIDSPDGKRFALVGHAGDSRVYHVHNNRLVCLTLDHTFINAMAKDAATAWEMQKRFSEACNVHDLGSKEEIEKYMSQNRISNALGILSSPTIISVEVQAGDRLLITSDGIHDNLTGTEIENIMASAQSPEDASSALMASAIARSHEKDPSGEREHLRAKMDDMTAVVIEVGK